MNLFKTLLACAGLIVTLSYANAVSIDEPETSLRTTVDSVLTRLKSNDTKEAKREFIVKTINDAFDFPLMSMISLKPEFRKMLTGKNREQYTDLYVKQLQNSYLDKLELYSNEKIEFEKAYTEGNKVVIPTKVLSGAEAISMDYKMYNKKGSWKIYDVVIEGISIVQTYRSQYSEILEKGSVDDLIAKMRERQESTTQEN